jgi:hypothetical protein
MRAHFPRPKTVSLSAWRTQSQYSMPGQHGVLAKEPVPGTSRPVCTGQSEEAARGWGGRADKEGWPQHDLDTEGHRPLCRHTVDVAEVRAGGLAQRPQRQTAHHGSQRQAVTDTHGLGRHRTGDRAARSGDGCAWNGRCLCHKHVKVCHSCKIKIEAYGGTHTHTYTHTHHHHHTTQQWIPLDRHRKTRGPIWAALVACLSRGPELNIQVLNKGLQRGQSF